MTRRIILAIAFVSTLSWSAVAAGEKDAGSAARAAALIDELQNPESDGRRFVLRQDDLNLYLRDLLAVRAPEGIKGIEVGLEEERLATVLDIDMDEIELSPGPAAGLVQLLLRGRQRLSLKGILTAKDGMGTFEVTEARINAVSLPPALVRALLSAVGKKQHPPFDPTQPFELPYGIRALDLLSGKAIIQR